MLCLSFGCSPPPQHAQWISRTDLQRKLNCCHTKIAVVTKTTPPSQSILTPGQPVLALNLQCEARIAQSEVCWGVRWRGVVDGPCSTGSDGRKQVCKCVGLAVLRGAALWIQPSSEPPVDGIFPLELTWFLTPFPTNSFR